MNIPGTLHRTPSLWEQAEAAILRGILDGTLAVGTKLPPIRQFGASLGVSFRTVQQALESLESKGFVSMRHGSGTYVESVAPSTGMLDAVVLCIETHAHLFGELAGMLTRRLHGMGRMPTMVDSLHESWQRLMMQTARSEAQIFVIHGGPHFHYGLFHDALFKEKCLVGIVEWSDDVLSERMSLALVDNTKGGEIVAQHLFAAGHRRVLIAGPDNMRTDPRRHGAAFSTVWDGQVDTVEITYDQSDVPTLDTRAAAAILRRPDAPTAVFGLRDYDVVCLARALLDEGIDLHKACEVIGYGNTPWSRGPVEFSSVDWNLDGIAEETCRFVAEAADGAERRHVRIEPRLVQRGASW